MTDTVETPEEQPAATPAPMKSLNEHVKEIIEAAPKKLGFSAVKSALKKAGVPTTGKARVTDAQIDVALEAEGIFQHPPKKEGGKPEYWHARFKSAEEIAADKAAKIAEAQAQKEADAIEKKRLADEAKVAKAAEAKAKKEAEKAQKLAEAEEKKRLADGVKAEKKRLADEAKLKKVGEKLRVKVDGLGDAPVPLSKLGKPTAKAGPEAAAEFERVLKDLVDKKRLFEHKGGKYGKIAPPPPPVPKQWFEATPAKKALDALAKAAKKVLDINGATAEYVLDFVRRALDEPANPNPVLIAELDLETFAKRVLAIAATIENDAKPYPGKVYIAAAWHATQRDAVFPKMTIDEFKRQLVEANRQQLLELSQATEVQDMDKKLLEESKTLQNQTTFQFLRTDGV